MASSAVSAADPFQRIIELLHEVRDLGTKMLELADSDADFNSLGPLNSHRSQLMEEMQALTSSVGINQEVLEFAGVTGKEILSRIADVLKQNENLQQAIHKRQQTLTEGLNLLNRVERAGKAYGQWHPVRMSQQEEEF